MITWLSNNYIELIGAITGLVYLYPEIKQKNWVWPFGAFSSLMFIVIFYENKFYADMGLQFYFLFISLYGWYCWKFSKKSKKEKGLHVSNIPLTNLLLAIVPTVIIYALIYIFLLKYTDSPVPHGDSLVTTLSIIATWMLAKKYIQMWYLWMIVNFISLILFFYKGMFPTGFLYIIYFGMSFYGFFEWKKDMIK